MVRVTGICNVQMDSLNTVEGEGAVRPQSMVILLRSAKDVAVIQAPSWWTRERALYGFAIVGTIVLAACGVDRLPAPASGAADEGTQRQRRAAAPSFGA